MPSLEASLRNLEQARAALSHPPRPLRCYTEARLIRQLVWQWWMHPDPQKWPGRKLARVLGVSHTWVQKLMRRFEADPGCMRGEMVVFGAANFDKLERARQETEKDRQRGYARGPHRFKLAEFKVGSNFVRAVVPTKAEERRRKAETEGSRLGPELVPFRDWPAWARGWSWSYGVPQNPGGLLFSPQGTPIFRLEDMVREPQKPMRVTRGYRRRFRPGRPW